MRRLGIIFMVIGFVVFGVTGAYNILNGEPVMGWIEIGFSVVLAVLVVIFRRWFKG